MRSWQHHFVNMGFLFLGKEDAEDAVSLGGVWVTTSIPKAGRIGRTLFLMVSPAGKAGYRSGR